MSYFYISSDHEDLVTLFEESDDNTLMQSCAMRISTFKRIRNFIGKCAYGKVCKETFIEDIYDIMPGQVYWTYEVEISKDKFSISATPNVNNGIYRIEAFECRPKDIVFEILEFRI